MRRPTARLYLSKPELRALASWHTHEAKRATDEADDPYEGQEPEELLADAEQHRQRADDLTHRADQLL